MKKPYLLKLFIAAAFVLINIANLGAQAVETAILDINNVSAGFGSSGNFFTSFDTANLHSPYTGFYLSNVPKWTNTRAIYTSALWMSGFDMAGKMHLAAQQYFDRGEDYFPGPVGDTLSSEVKYCRQVFVITRAAVSQFESLSSPITWSMIDSSILEWPAKGNTYLDTFRSVNITSALAPFVDVDGDGIYNPLKGDHPDFCGDDAVFFVFNDSAKQHSQTLGAKLGFEIRALAEEFVEPASGFRMNEKTAVNNTVFLKLDIENKSSTSYSDFHLGLFEDPDFGCGANDRVGCDTNRNMMFVYNGTPDYTCRFFLGPLQSGYYPYQAAHGVLMLNQKIGGFAYYTNGGVAAISGPITAVQYQNYLTGYWADGTPLTEGGIGYGGVNPTRFCFPGDPNDPTQWSEVQVADSLQASDRKMVGTTGPLNFNAGEIKHFDFAFITSYDSLATMLGIIDTLKRDADSIQAFYNNVFSPCRNQLPAAVKNGDKADNLEFTLFPNPAKGQINIQAGSYIQSLEFSDLEGRLITKLANLPARYTLDVSKLAKGVYLCKIASEGKIGIKRVFVD